MTISNPKHMLIKLSFLFATGLFASLSMAPTNFWPALFFGLSSLYIIIERASSPLKAGILSFIFSLGYFGFSLSWIGNALLVENNPYRWAWPLAISVLPVVLSLFPSIGAIIYKRLSQNYIKQENSFLNYITFCTLISLSDYARGTLFTGFPWNLYAYTWIDILPIAQIVSLGDIYILNTITIFWAVSPAFILGSKKKYLRKALFFASIASTFIVSYIWGYNKIENYKHYATQKDAPQIILVQPNIKQSEKWNPEKRAENFLSLVEMSKYRKENDTGANMTIIVWPETAISQDILDIKWTMEEIKNMLSQYPRNVLLITGALRLLPAELSRSKTDTLYNSIITFNKNAHIIDIYNKRHLVPFGEYIPLDSYINFSPVVGFAGFQKGDNANTRNIHLQSKAGKQETSYILRYINLICYEAVFPEYAKVTTLKKPDFIVNVTNDAWYGKSAGPYQHMTQVRFRAIESGLPLIRSANTGISAIIDPIGNKLLSIDLMKKDILCEKLPQAID